MSTRQYIGARYVPRFVGIYDPTQAYDALDVVDNGSGTTYIARIQTPPNTPLTDTTHWLVYGSSSGAILDLQGRVTTLENDDATIKSSILSIGGQVDINTGNISALDNRVDDAEDELDIADISLNIWHNKKVCVYGDSLSSIEENYWKYLVQLDPTITVTNRAVGGTRIQDGVALLNAATDLDTFDIVVLAYGTNSWANTQLRAMVQSYQQAFNIISGKAPLVQTVCIAPFFSYNNDYTDGIENTLHLSLYDYCNAICHIATMNGAIPINLYGIAGVNRYNYSVLIEGSNGVYVHEKAALARRIAHLLLSGITTPTPAYGYSYIETNDGAGLYIVKTPIFTLLTTRGRVNIAALEALSIEHISPAANPSGVGITNQGVARSVVWYSAGNFLVVNKSSSDTEISALNIIGVNGNYRG